MKKLLIIITIILFSFEISGQTIKILFDASKAETAGNADWVIDADQFNLGFGTGPATLNGGTEANAQQIPTPLQNTITASTLETYWKGGLSNWGIDCVKKGYVVETLPYNGFITYNNSANPQDLSKYNIFVIVEPNIQFTATEKAAIINFVKFGGSLMMVSDHTVSDRNNDGWDSPAIWNDLMQNNSVQADPFGIIFDIANFSQTTTNIASNANDSLLHGIYGNVTSVMWSNGTSMAIEPQINSSVKAAVFKTGSSNTGTSNVMVAYARYGQGKIAAIGDSSPCDDGTGDNNDNLYNGYTQDANGNHQRLLMNAMVWLATTQTTTAVVSTNSLFNYFKIYPMPSRQNININYSLKTSNIVQFVLTNANGELVKKWYKGFVSFGQHNEILNVETLSSGYYILTVQIGNNKTSQPIIIQ